MRKGANEMAKHNKHLFRLNSRRAAIVVYECLGVVVVALIAVLLTLTYVVRVVGVDGTSMMPTLKDNDRLLLTYYEKTYDRGDIVVIDRYGEEPLIKRIIAIGNDTVEIEHGQVRVNGDLLKEFYIQGTTEIDADSNAKRKWEVQEGFVFVMGDNRNPGASVDSRKDSIGLISVKDIVGRARWCIWPPSSFGSIYD